MSVNTLEVSQQSAPDIPASATNDSTLTEADNDYIGAADRMLDNEQPLDDQHNDKTDGAETSQETRFSDLSEPSDIDGKHPHDDAPPSHNDEYIGAADRMLDNEQPLQDPLDETDSDIDSPPAPESSMENNSETESKKDTYHDAGDIQRSPATETTSPNSGKLGDTEQMLNQEQPPDNNDSTIEPGSPQKSTETADKTNNDPAAEETRELPSPAVEDHPTRSHEDTEREVGQDSDPKHLTDPQSNKPPPDQQLAENNDTKPTQLDEDLPSTEVGQLNEKAVETNEIRLVSAGWENKESSTVTEESTANLHPYSDDLTKKLDVPDVGIQGLLLQRVHGLDLEPSEEHDTGILRPDRGLPDTPPGYEIAPQIKPSLQQPIDPTHTRRSPAGDTPSTGNDNNGHGIPNENPPPDDPSHNADAALQLRAASSTETNNKSNGDDHVSPDHAGDTDDAADGADAQKQGSAPAADAPATKPQVTNTKLGNIIDKLYKGTENPGRVGDGTTADAVRYERQTGDNVHGRHHSQKAVESIRALQNFLRKASDASEPDRLVAEREIANLRDALGLE